jgi:hypothetical protein
MGTHEICNGFAGAGACISLLGIRGSYADEKISHAKPPRRKSFNLTMIPLAPKPQQLSKGDRAVNLPSPLRGDFISPLTAVCSGFLDSYPFGFV